MKRTISFALTLILVAALFGGCDNFVESKVVTNAV